VTATAKVSGDFALVLADDNYSSFYDYRAEVVDCLKSTNKSWCCSTVGEPYTNELIVFIDSLLNPIWETRPSVQ